VVRECIPEIESLQETPSEATERPETALESPDKGEEGDLQKPSERRSWLYRFFFEPQ
jgi:hypothetical protein